MLHPGEVARGKNRLPSTPKPKGKSFDYTSTMRARTVMLVNNLFLYAHFSVFIQAQKVEGFNLLLHAHFSIYSSAEGGGVSPMRTSNSTAPPPHHHHQRAFP